MNLKKKKTLEKVLQKNVHLWPGQAMLRLKVFLRIVHVCFALILSCLFQLFFGFMLALFYVFLRLISDFHVNFRILGHV